MNVQTNTYEKFIERYYQRSLDSNSTKSKGEVVKEAQELWKSKFSKDENSLKSFLMLKPGERPFDENANCHEVGEKICDFGFVCIAWPQNSSMILTYSINLYQLMVYLLVHTMN